MNNITVKLNTHGSFKHFQKCLLDPLPRYISARVYVLTLIRKKQVMANTIKSTTIASIDLRPCYTFLVILSTSSIYTIPRWAASTLNSASYTIKAQCTEWGKVKKTNNEGMKIFPKTSEKLILDFIYFLKWKVREKTIRCRALVELSSYISNRIQTPNPSSRGKLIAR